MCKFKKILLLTTSVTMTNTLFAGKCMDDSWFSIDSTNLGKTGQTRQTMNSSQSSFGGIDLGGIDDDFYGSPEVTDSIQKLPPAREKTIDDKFEIDESTIAGSEVGDELLADLDSEWELLTAESTAAGSEVGTAGSEVGTAGSEVGNQLLADLDESEWEFVAADTTSGDSLNEKFNIYRDQILNVNELALSAAGACNKADSRQGQYKTQYKWQKNNFESTEKWQAHEIEGTSGSSLNPVKDEARAVLAFSPEKKTFIISFHGTRQLFNPFSVDNRANMSFWPTRAENVKGLNLPEGVKVHIGFARCAASSAENIFSKIKELIGNDGNIDQYNVIFSGYSQGAGIAQIAVADFIKRIQQEKPDFDNKESNNIMAYLIASPSSLAGETKEVEGLVGKNNWVRQNHVADTVPFISRLFYKSLGSLALEVHETENPRSVHSFDKYERGYYSKEISATINELINNGREHQEKNPFERRLSSVKKFTSNIARAGSNLANWGLSKFSSYIN